MSDEVRLVRRVELSETDLAGIVHFTNYLKWIEAAEAAFFEQVRLPLVTDSVESMQGWPRVEIAATYAAPLRFGDRVEVRLRLLEVRASALRWEAAFHKIDPESGLPLEPPAASATMTTLHSVLDRRTRGIRATLIPDPARARLQARINHEAHE